MTKTVKTKKPFVEYVWTLADGTEIYTSPKGAAKLRGVTTGGHIQRTFIAYMDASWVPARLRHLLNSPTSVMHHLGCYTDSRDAAAVSALAQDPELMEHMLVNYQSSGLDAACTNRYPETELCESRFDMDEMLTNTEVQTRRIKRAKASAARKVTRDALSKAEKQKREDIEDAAILVASKFELNSDSASEIRKNIMEEFGMNFFFGLDVVAKSAIRTLTWEDWKSEYGPNA
jgi:hypothetical protein